MSERTAIAGETAAGLRAFAKAAAHKPVMVGFDGFVDSIIQVVDKRHDTERFDAIPSIEQFGKRIVAAAGQSSNFEMVTRLQKLGGNGPIMANALSRAGLPVTYIGALGYPSLHEVFAEFANEAKVHSIAEPGFTDALEFDDGKLMLGKYAHMSSVDQLRINTVIGEEAYGKMVAQSHLIGMVNWTMLPGMESIWQELWQRILPQAKMPVGSFLFIDLADPAKRTEEDLKRAMETIATLNKSIDVVMGLNFAEARQVAGVVGIQISRDEQAIEETACVLRQALRLHGVVVHPRKGAAAAIETGGEVASGCFWGPFVRQPKLSTGAGDNFNAGFCLGLLAGLTVEQALCAGTATSGYYVRNAQSPRLAELAAFCDTLPEPEGVTA